MAELVIHPPLAGIVRSRGFQQQPPYSCRISTNFWPTFALDGSETLAIRPPLDQFISSPNPVNLLCRVNGTTSQTPQRTFLAGINGGLFRWAGGTTLTLVGGAGTIPTGRAAFAQAFEQKVYIPAASPLVYDYPSDTLAAWTATDGTVPVDPRIVVYWAGGLWVAAIPNTPHIVSGCRTGDPLDWDFTQEDEGAAFSTIGDNAGLISDPVTALIPVSGDTMIVSTPDGMQAWRGHPRRGGVADVLSDCVGVRGQGAWCQGPDGAIYAVTNKGLVAIQNTNVVELISQERIPSELIGFDYDYLDPRINLAFDARFHGIHITRRGADAANSEAWFYDLRHHGLWEQEFSQYPYVMLNFDPIGTGRASEVLLGGSGGLYRFDLDGTESINRARIVIGPMKLSPNATQRRMIQEAQVVFGGGTNAMSAEVNMFCGPTGDSAFAACEDGDGVARYETTVDNVFRLQGRLRPRVAGHAGVIEINQAAPMTNPVLIVEEIPLQLEPAGRERGYVLHSDKTGPRAGSVVTPGVHIGAPLFAYYKLDENSDTRADSHTHDLDLVESASTNYPGVAGKVGQAIDMDDEGASRFLDNNGVTAPFNTTGGCSLAFWFRYDGSLVGVSATPVRCFTADVTYRVRFVPSINGILFEAIDGSANTIQAAVIDADVFDGSFHLITAAISPEFDRAWIATDNNPQTVVDAAAFVPEGTQDMEIIIENAGTTFDFALDELAIFNGVLTESDQIVLWNSGSGRTYPLP